ncbi:hypothetical protein [Mucilaginibacter ginsenosidivorax]|uniref:DUF4126 family protein n=1 Tax=Mucilaginibacter ginsenosidivorax TaxID=862126 RepID=A0A5B8VSY5_9SPHI|nr:hypothetical protein [Mucilaginibacter ginsenosidivorax]QEC74754.1 hypothetical protein FSB76_01875 [Mucilaginibacter ginsenosidivorax]
MKIISSLIGGLAGAAALNLLHQTAKQFVPDAPRVDLVGEEAVFKGLDKVGINPPTGNVPFTATMAADLISNSVYYNLIGFGKKKHLLVAGAASGLTAGIGALKLTKPTGLSDTPITRTHLTKVLTVVWYTFCGLVDGTVMYALRKRA